MCITNRIEDIMAASKPVILPGDEIIKEVECRVCLEQTQLRIISCGHKLFQDCIGKISTPSNLALHFSIP